ncbi:SlyX family protein [Diaphorobacter sp. HDW4B]|uniref:SlyX family protein n=1 Tax=Diaphorobacter sp. HDW4B TaxID=2714925 RepID=UPI00140B1EB4|nr:SlyX family protein [Diaphorobacter sp. HDW4B]QIL69619.1 SlyX family protein [Diaphorobacter sp. HDW4B]
MSDFNEQTDQRLSDLEIKASFTEDLLDQLNLTIYRQQQQIDDLIRVVADLRKQLPEAGALGSGQAILNERPPHY